MKATRQIGILVFIAVINISYGQIDVREDIYTLRNDTGLNYFLHVRNNDTPYADIKIFALTKLGASANQYTATIIDSNYILIASSTADTFSGHLTYKGKDKFGNIDSTDVYFVRTNIAPSVRPGDANRDNLVNHFDIFPIGLMYNRRGESRHNSDTNINFSIPKRIADWTFGTGGINGKYADIDGNSLIEIKDYERLKLNLGNSSGNYSPKLSDTNSLNTFRLQIADTVVLESKDSNKIKIPILLVKSVSTPSYGLGFSTSVSYLANTTQQDSFYNKYKYLTPDNGSLWNGVSSNNLLFLEDKISRPNHTNIAYCKTNGTNGDIRDDIGVVEIIVDEILWGQAGTEKDSRIHVRISEPCWIDNNYNTIPLRPISKYVYIRKAKSSILSSENIEIKVYPTIAREKFILENLSLKPLEYTIYNPLGELIKQGKADLGKHELSSFDWSNGIYYLKINESSKVFRIIKE